jgi:hypothetical protein
MRQCGKPLCRTAFSNRRYRPLPAVRIWRWFAVAEDESGRPRQAQHFRTVVGSNADKAAPPVSATPLAGVAKGG